MKRVFISFRHEDKAQVNGLRLLAANGSFDIEFYDESLRTAIDSTNATYVRSKIREKINRTSVTVCMVSALIDPAYYDITIRRLGSVCGLEAVLEATGRRFGEVEAERAAAAENLGEAAPSPEGVA